MPFAFVAAMGGVGFVDVTVATFEFGEDAAFVDYSGTQGNRIKFLTTIE